MEGPARFIKGVKFRENVRAFFPLGQSELSLRNNEWESVRRVKLKHESGTSTNFCCSCDLNTT